MKRSLGTLQAAESTKAGSLRHPAGIGVAENGELFVVDRGNARIVVFTPDGQCALLGCPRSGNGQFKLPMGLALHRELVFVVDSGNHRVQVFKRNGTFVRAWGSNGSGDSQFLTPTVMQSSQPPPTRCSLWITEITEFKSSIRTDISFANGAARVLVLASSFGQLLWLSVDWE